MHAAFTKLIRSSNSLILILVAFLFSEYRTHSDPVWQQLQSSAGGEDRFRTGAPPQRHPARGLEEHIRLYAAAVPC